MVQPYSPEMMRRDVHPADVAIGEHVVTGVRVFITDRRLLAFRATPSGSIEIALELELARPCSVSASRATLGHGQLEARLADGRTAWVNRGRGCGCGSPLKALAPPVGWTAR